MLLSFYNADMFARPDMDEVFVFGSNDLGVHGAGAALAARRYYGARQGQPSGLQGRSYGIVTRHVLPFKPGQVKTELKSLTLEQIEKEINIFINFTMERSDLRFLVTPVGTGRAGYENKQIAPMFRGAKNCRFPDTWITFMTK
jgi:hypothetical protein